MSKELSPIQIRKLFDDLREGTLSEQDADLTLYDEGVSLEVRDALFLMHKQGEERSAAQTGWPTNVLQNSSLAGPYTERGAPEVRIAPEWKHAYRINEPSPLGPQDPDHFCSRPECKPVDRREFPDRVIWGESAQCAFTRWRVMDACIYQRVAVPVGALLTLEAEVQAWCSNSDDPAACDGEFYFRVGIDLTGAQGPFVPEDRSTTIWGSWIRALGAYQTIKMQAIDAGPNVTVYVNFWNKYRYSHNDAYIDAVRLLVDTPIPDPKPPSGEYVSWGDLALVFRDMADMIDERPVE